MSESKRLLRSLVGPGRQGLDTLALSVDVATQLLFEQNVSVDQLLVTKDIYPRVARLMKKPASAVTRQAERMQNLCWEAGDPKLLETIIGRKLQTEPAPREMLIYLAYYRHYGKSFFEMMEE